MGWSEIEARGHRSPFALSTFATLVPLLFWGGFFILNDPQIQLQSL